MFKHTTGQPMKLIIDLDWTTRCCPCGVSISSRFTSDNDWQDFLQEHYKHTNGMEMVIVTDDGARCLVEKPEPRLTKLAVPT